MIIMIIIAPVVTYEFLHMKNEKKNYDNLLNRFRLIKEHICLSFIISVSGSFILSTFKLLLPYFILIFLLSLFDWFLYVSTQSY